MSQSNSAQMQDVIRQEMQQVLAEMSSNSRNVDESRRFGSASIPLAGRPPDEVIILRERVAILEDALSKSEADRSAVYAKYQAAVKALDSANAEKSALMHEYHDTTTGMESALAHRQEVESLKTQMRAMGDQYEAHIAQLQVAYQEKDAQLKKMKKSVKSREDKVDGVSLADLHYSNERLSAQLAKLQTSTAQPSVDESKVAACEAAVNSLNAELGALEARLKQQVATHAAETQQLQERLEVTRREYDLERAECDRVVAIMSAKLEALVSENNFLRTQVAAATQAQLQLTQQVSQQPPAPSPRSGAARREATTSGRKLYY
jgi:chromosome segregation ATPase